MHTIKALESGQLQGSTHIKLACGLHTFPDALLQLADTLEILDMTDNKLSQLPDTFAQFKKLRILFLSNNEFTQLPTVLAQCPNLSMIGFRNNHIDTVAEHSLPLSTRWLILTDNQIRSLPNSIGDLIHLQKCMLSGNKLTALPQTLEKCHNLELLRISVNELTQLPLWLLTLPKLSWLAYSGNPFCNKHPSCDTVLKEIAWHTLQIGALLGEGASGQIFQARYEEKEVAVKIFKGEITSDGLPQEEMDINISMGQHTHLVDVMGRVTGHPAGLDALMLELIPPHFFNLGLPPTLDSCSRDVYPESFTLTLVESIKILQGMASAAVHMHERGIMHGDFYAHNIMIDTQANAILGDFGGASFFAPEQKETRMMLERLEVRAFGYLIEEMLLLSKSDESEKERNKLKTLQIRCLSLINHERPLFKEINETLSSM